MNEKETIICQTQKQNGNDFNTGDTLTSNQGNHGSFIDHLFWPVPLRNDRKRKKEKLPSAIASSVYRKFLPEKENRQKKETEEKEKKQKRNSPIN